MTLATRSKRISTRAISKSSDAFFRFWVAKLGVGVVNAHASSFTPCLRVLLPGCPNSGFADEMAQPKRNLKAAREGLMIGPGRDQGNLGRTWSRNCNEGDTEMKKWIKVAISI